MMACQGKCELCAWRDSVRVVRGWTTIRVSQGGGWCRGGDLFCWIVLDTYNELFNAFFELQSSKVSIYSFSEFQNFQDLKVSSFIKFPKMSERSFQTILNFKNLRFPQIICSEMIWDFWMFLKSLCRVKVKTNWFWGSWTCLPGLESESSEKN